jgi:hypothetical protein
LFVTVFAPPWRDLASPRLRRAKTAKTCAIPSSPRDPPAGGLAKEPGPVTGGLTPPTFTPSTAGPLAVVNRAT